MQAAFGSLSSERSSAAPAFSGRAHVCCAPSTSYPRIRLLFKVHASVGCNVRRTTSGVVGGSGRVEAHAVATDAPVAPAPSSGKEPWWRKHSTSNMIDVTSVQQLVNELAMSRDKLVIVDFYARWCGACRALHPKVCKLIAEHPDVLLMKVNWDDNKSMVKAMGVRALPYFQVYRGSEGRVAAFSCNVTKFQLLRDVFDTYASPRCGLGEVPNLEEFPDVTPEVFVVQYQGPGQVMGATKNGGEVVENNVVVAPLQLHKAISGPQEGGEVVLP